MHYTGTESKSWTAVHIDQVPAGLKKSRYLDCTFGNKDPMIAVRTVSQIRSVIDHKHMHVHMLQWSLFQCDHIQQQPL